MENVRHELIQMIRLQAIYDQIAQAITEQETPPADVLELEEENRRRQRELEELEERIEEIEEELREVRRKEEESKLELEHFQKQRAAVTNEREFTAVINEIDFATRALEEAEARRKELEGAEEEIRAEIQTRKEARPEEEASHREVVERWAARQQELKELIHTLAEQARTIEEGLHPANRSRFLRLLKSKQGRAMAPAIEGSCSLCHFALRPHVQQRVRRAEEIITCEHCHRILYLPELGEDGDEG